MVIIVIRIKMVITLVLMEVTIMVRLARITTQIAIAMVRTIIMVIQTRATIQITIIMVDQIIMGVNTKITTIITIIMVHPEIMETIIRTKMAITMAIITKIIMAIITKIKMAITMALEIISEIKVITIRIGVTLMEIIAIKIMTAGHNLRDSSLISKVTIRVKEGKQWQIEYLVEIEATHLVMDMDTVKPMMDGVIL